MPESCTAPRLSIPFRIQVMIVRLDFHQAVHTFQFLLGFKMDMMVGGRMIRGQLVFQFLLGFKISRFSMLAGSDGSFNSF